MLRCLGFVVVVVVAVRVVLLMIVNGRHTLEERHVRSRNTRPARWPTLPM